MNRILPFAIAACLLAAAAPVAAWDGRYDGRGYYDDGYGYDYARVLAVDPIVERTAPTTYRQCYRTPERRYVRHDGYYGERHAHSTASGAVLGAIVGGALGNTVGKGDGRRAATIAGAMIGAGVGADLQRREHYRDAGYYPRTTYVEQEVERCRWVQAGYDDERVVGYRVSYEYAGRRYETVTDYHPGSQLRVRVDVRPE